jgi:hypothetical protein
MDESTSIIRLRRITLLAQHLQVVVGGMPALAPRNDVVAFHILKGVLGADAICNAQGTLVTLPLIGAKLLRFSERTKGQVLFIAPSAVREDERDNATRAELSTGKIDRRNKHPNACDTCKNRWLYSNHLFLQIPIILSSHTYAMIFVQKENENAVINGVLAKDSSF